MNILCMDRQGGGLATKVLVIFPVLALAEDGAVIDFVAACTFIKSFSSTVNTGLLNTEQAKNSVRMPNI